MDALRIMGETDPTGSLSINALRAYSKHRRPFSHRTKRADLSIFVFCPFSRKKIDINSEKCIEYGK